MLIIILFGRKCFISIVLANGIVSLTVSLRQISHYSVASTSEAAFVVGGWLAGSDSDEIAKFQNNKWSSFGNLQRGRHGHRIITYVDDIMVFGGGAADGS